MKYNYRGYTPQQGDIVSITFDPQRGREIKKRRPALVVSSTAYNEKTGFVQVCPITHTYRDGPGYVDVPKGLNVDGQIIAIQLRSFDFTSSARNIRRIDIIDTRTFGIVAQYIIYIFNFNSILDF